MLTSLLVLASKRQLPGTSATTMARLSSLVRAVPAYRLAAGTDPAGVAAAVERILEDA